MKKDFLYLSGIVMMLCICTMLIMTTCSSSKSGSPVASDDVSNRYRTMIHNSFTAKARSHNADTKYLLLVDYSIPSNKDRFFVWDNERDEIVAGFWCAHGLGGNSTAEKPEFSNTLGSNCSSLGWFLVDKSVGTSSYGYKYHAVDGLSASNSNARRRQLLIHHWHSVSADEEARINKPMALDYRSAGCFTLSDKGFRSIDQFIRSRQKPLLLLAINGL